MAVLLTTAAWPASVAESENLVPNTFSQKGKDKCCGFLAPHMALLIKGIPPSTVLSQILTVLPPLKCAGCWGLLGIAPFAGRAMQHKHNAIRKHYATPTTPLASHHSFLLCTGPTPPQQAYIYSASDNLFPVRF